MSANLAEHSPRGFQSTNPNGNIAARTSFFSALFRSILVQWPGKQSTAVSIDTRLCKRFWSYLRRCSRNEKYAPNNFRDNFLAHITPVATLADDRADWLEKMR